MSASANISKMLAGLRAARGRKLAAAKRALDIAGEKVLGDAQQLTPVATGALQASGTSEPTVESAGSIQKNISFNTDYALFVHENLTAHHDTGQAKFLETAINRNREKVLQFVADEMAKVND